MKISLKKPYPKKTWESLQLEAESQIKDADEKYKDYLEKKEQYKKDIALFVEKYSDYYNNKSHYDRLGMGTGEDWDAEQKKKESGFEFAPQAPYCPINSGSKVYRHWISITSGIVPFGYSVTNDE